MEQSAKENNNDENTIMVGKGENEEETTDLFC